MSAAASTRRYRVIELIGSMILCRFLLHYVIVSLVMSSCRPCSCLSQRSFFWKREEVHHLSRLFSILWVATLCHVPSCCLSSSCLSQGSFQKRNDVPRSSQILLMLQMAILCRGPSRCLPCSSRTCGSLQERRRPSLQSNSLDL